MSIRAAVGVWTLALLAAGAGTAQLVASDHPDYFTARGVLGIATALLFVAAGLITSLRRPENRIGWIMVLVGFAWFLSVLPESNHPLVFGLGALTQDWPWVLFGFLVLSYPTGRLEDWQSRVAVGGASVVALILRPAWTLVSDLEDYHAAGPSNGLLVSDNPGAADALLLAIQLTALVVIVLALAVLTRRWRGASTPTRRTLTPVYASFGFTAVLLAVSVFMQALGLEQSKDVYWAALFSLLLVPVAFAVGLLRTRLARAGIGQLLVDLGDTRKEADIRDALARTLGDPTLEIAYWLPEQRAFVSREGNPLAEPLVPAGSGRHVTVVERRGHPVAALIHDTSVLGDHALLDAASAAAGLSLENERRLAELRQSEARLRALVEALPDLMFRVHRDGTYLAVQAHDAHLLVRPPEELVGRSVRDVLPAETAGRIMDAIERLGPGHPLETVEYSLELASGIRHFETRLAPIGDEEAVLVVRDITDRTERELQVRRLRTQLELRLEELNRERELNRAVVQASPSFFCIIDGRGLVERFNRALEMATGCVDGPATRGTPFWDLFVSDEDSDDVQDFLLEALASSEPTSERQHRWKGCDDEPMYVAWAVTPLRDEAEERFLITGTDVTDRVRHEADLRQSRARIVEAGSVERRRLERNLHDGAQQRLVSLSLSLRLALGKVHDDPEGAERLLTGAADELARALEELRELARGIHPAVLTDRGLEPALQSLVTRAPVPVTVAEAPAERLPEPVEAAAYYVVAEALTNVAKYANARAATVRVSRANGRAVVEVADDGVGGADLSRGSGLRGLADRVAALDGTLEITSPPGGGTTIRAEIPV